MSKFNRSNQKSFTPHGGTDNHYLNEYINNSKSNSKESLSTLRNSTTASTLSTSKTSINSNSNSNTNTNTTNTTNNSTNTYTNLTNNTNNTNNTNISNNNSVFTTTTTSELNDTVKSQWRKEKNRLAAKKSREKKAMHIKELEQKSKILDINCRTLIETVHQYDQLLQLYINYSMELAKMDGAFKVNKQFVNFMKDIKIKNGFSLNKVQQMTNARIFVCDEQLEEVVEELSKMISDQRYNKKK